MNKVILITGASSGMGKATALELIESGYTVYGAARRVEKMQDIVDKGGHALHLDVTKPDEITSAVNQIINDQGRINVLINNAGYAVYGSIEDTTLEDARQQFEVNLFGAASLTRAVLPVMRERKSGKIINISSMGGKIYTPLGAWYHASKHALEAWSDCLRLEVKQFGIDVVIIEPGLITTDFGDVMIKPLLERSGQGPYSAIAQSVAETTRETYQPENSSSPSVVVDTILKAIRSKKPKTRYTCGKMARPLISLRKYLSDRLFDKALMSQIK